ELGEEKVRIYTSILTIQEVSVLMFRRGTLATDHFTKVHRIARVENITKDVALTAAKLEAHLKDVKNANATKDEQIAENRRRKWDCFHIATAMTLGCRTLFS